MALTKSERETLLSRWIKPSSNNEQIQQIRAERMINDAISSHGAFDGTAIRIYAKGSYANNTNVRLDSDVDIVVENHECSYYDYHGDRPARPASKPYEGPWTPEAWRREVTNAIVNHFGIADMDTSGNIALVVSAKPGSRPSADVVPSFLYYRYDTADQRLKHQGSKVFKRSTGSIVNWPQQQLDNGRAKNNATGQRYKNYVRVLKNAENYLVEQGTIEEKPSYLMECLVWNVPNSTLTQGDLDDAFCRTLAWLWQHLNDGYVYEDWEEPNRLRYLFWAGQKWSIKDARETVLETWKLMGY